MKLVSALQGTAGARSTELLGPPVGTWEEEEAGPRRRLGRGGFREGQVCAEHKGGDGSAREVGGNVPGWSREMG